MTTVGLITSWVFGEKTAKVATATWAFIVAIGAAIVGFIQVAIDWLYSIFLWFGERVSIIVDATVPEIPWESISYILSLGNAFFPITEAIAMYATLYTFWGVVLTVRWVKSFVPTLAG